MFSRSDAATEVPTSSAERRGSHGGRSGQVGRTASDRSSRLPQAALAYAARCHLGQRRESDGAPFIEHLSEVARLLRDAGCSDVVIAAGLLHSVLQDSDVSTDELTERFGASVCRLVLTMTDDGVASYSQRKQAFRERFRQADNDAVQLFAADEVAEVRELADQVRRERSRVGAAAPPDAARERVERYQQMCLEHHRASLAMLQRVAAGHRIVRQLADELYRFPVTLRRVNPTGAR